MWEFRSNCYWFVHAWLKNTEDEFFLPREEAFEWIKWIKKWSKIEKIYDDTIENIWDILSGTENNYNIIEIFDDEKRSQHLAFIDKWLNFHDQNGPDWEIRTEKDIEILLRQYTDIFWTAYYQIHILDEILSNNVQTFLNEQCWVG